MTEEQLEKEALGWLQEPGYSHRFGQCACEIAFTGKTYFA
jgi:hypothetical protein